MRNTTAYFQIRSFLARSALHEHFPVIPEPIREYIEEVKAQLEEVTLSPGVLSIPSKYTASDVALQMR